MINFIFYIIFHLFMQVCAIKCVKHQLEKILSKKRKHSIRFLLELGLRKMSSFHFTFYFLSLAMFCRHQFQMLLVMLVSYIHL